MAVILLTNFESFSSRSDISASLQFGDLDEPTPGPIYYRTALSLVFLRFIDLLRSRASLAEPDRHTKRGRESGLKHIELFCAR